MTVVIKWSKMDFKGVIIRNMFVQEMLTVEIKKNWLSLSADNKEKINQLPHETAHISQIALLITFSQLYLIPPSTKYVLRLSMTKMVRISL
jgi:hypothetical protein